MKHGREKSDLFIVATKPANKPGQPGAESVERREGTEGNTGEPDTCRTQCRESVPQGLERVRQAAKARKKERFTALFHHLTVDLLKEAYFWLKRNAAPGVDGLRWGDYEQDLEANVVDLHARIHRGGYRAQPSRRKYIAKADGRQRPLGIAALEDKIVQRALVEVLNAIYEEDFVGFSYGSRSGRSPHDALDALATAITRMKVDWVLDADIRGFFDAVSHEWLVRFLEHRIGDKRVIGLICKWLKAGVMEDGVVAPTDVGTPKGRLFRLCWQTSTCITSSTCGPKGGVSTMPEDKSSSCDMSTISSSAFSTRLKPGAFWPIYSSGWGSLRYRCIRTRHA